ncbi:MAG: Gfo/Idh/MocA family oxidoreductase [Planctomycetia bacterium]|nr:Gfo/Idh/MocA family oxidoreductase [Planctomycetia bacterium]
MAAKFRVAVIGRTGKGNYGHGIDTVWLETERAQLVGVADDDKAGLAEAAKRLKVDQAFSDYRLMLDKLKPDIAAICPRWLDQHRDMVLAAAERGIHVYMEKPFCRTLAEADEMVTACERTHVKLAIAHQTRYSPKLSIVKELIAAGKIGKVLEFRARGKEDARGGGEDLWVLGTHLMDVIRAIGGHPAWCFGHVTRDGRPITKSDVVEGAEGIGPLAGDGVTAVYGMPDGATAYFASRKAMAGKGSRFGVQILGSAGILEILTGHLPSVKYLGDPAWSPGRSGVAWQDVSTQGIGQPETMKDGGLHGGNLLAVNDLMDAIEKQRQPIGNMYEARGATEMIVAVFESHRQARPVPLPLENRKNPLTML